MFRSRRAKVIFCVMIAVLAAVLFAPLLTYREAQSPDGAFIAIAQASVFGSLVPMLPGQGGDKPGRIMIVRKDGRSCGSTAVEMLAMVGDIRWRLDANPRAADIVGVATWDLDSCTVATAGR